MTLEEFNLWFDPIYNEMDPVRGSKHLKLIDGGCGDTDEKSFPSESIQEKISDYTIVKFYSFISEWKLKWRTKEDFEVKAEGTFDFLPLKEVMIDVWDDSLGGNDWNPEMKGFRPLDMFYDIDGFVGFYVGRPEKKGLYVQHSDSSVSPLYVDLDGYLRLLGMSKGFGWWQNALVEIHSGNPMPNVASFREKMPKIFPDFSWDAFVALYEEVRIDK
jgi:hypothetical protein